ncbi:unnamed protein product [Rotaria sp. Silwood1]|nr:unnamed protein product [Rotaria sp. Silwood1]CAF0839853.1 unnamed protein product [Rotaria sp. Silwood1]CAF3341181.1 unnamed protein product [Rotaria sp. Silwood1]CAF4562792.1 unnamed protein product [Rotaria sp. Silwood1]
MIFGGAFGLIFIGFISILFIICCFLIYLKWFHKINIKYSSIGLGGIENFDINHNLFHLHIKYINFLSSFSIFILRLPIISIDNIHLKINSIKNKIINKKKQKKDWHKKLYFLKYVSIRIEQLQIQYENINIFFHHITLHPSATPNTTNSDTWINCEYIELSIIDKIEQFSSNNSSFVLLKSTWHSVEIQTNFDQNLLINSTHWSIELDYKLFDYLKQKQTHSTVQQYQRETSNFLYEDPNLLSITQTTHSNNLLIKFDQWVEFFYDPFINICIRQIDLQYRSIDNTLHYHTFDKVDFSFHNSSNGSFQTQHAYIANIRLHSHSTLLLHGLCQITIFPTRLDIACQFNELNIELCEDTIQQFHTLLSSRSSTSSNNTWKCDRQIDISFQFLNPFMRLKMNDINELFIWQINFFKLSFHSNENSETNFSQSLIDDLSRQHLWYCLLYLPNASITISKIYTTHVEIEIIGIRLQSNHILISFLKRLQIILSSSKKSKINSNRFNEISLHMKSITIIICDTVPVYLCVSISTIRASRTQIDMKKNLIYFDNQPSDKIPLTSLTHGQKIFDVRRISIQHHPNNYTIKISVPHDLTFVLSTKLYLFLYRYISSLKFNNDKTTIVSNNDDNNKNQTIANDIEFKVDKCAHIHLQLSTDSRILLELHQFSSRFVRNSLIDNETQMQLKCSQLTVDWQQQCLFVVHDISFIRLIQSEILTTERILLQKTIGSLDMLHNRASLLQINSFSIHFPFDSTFNEVIEKFINIRKWLKRLHKTNGDMSSTFLSQVPKHTISNEVWTDLSIKINEFELTIIDDLFEVKLFQNYCLMADEYHERELREQELQHRIDGHEKISQPLNNINELKKALMEANSRVYIKRCQKTNYDENNQRIKRNLIRWHLRQVDLIALADQSWTGKENILNIIHRIDYDSPRIPIDTSDLCTIWCRYVILKCDDWSIHFRDFRQPLWQMQQFHLWGHICAAETTPDSLDSIRTPWIDIGEPYSPSRVQVQRLLSPLKFYHDINSDIDSFVISFGPAWENTIAQVNLCLNSITPRTVDPSSLLPWWDKIRLYLHGRWSFAANKMSWLYHVGSNPYNDTEEMEWVWDQAYVDWTNGKFIIKASSLSIKLRTSSKYDDCCLLYLPNVDTRISLNWLCAGNPNDHNAVRLATRDAVKSRQKQESYDSYALYRSLHLNATAKFECKDVPEGETPPTCTIFASTLRFCESVKNTMMSITRPTRRGRLFLSPGETVVPPRKPLLSRHYQTAELQLILPQFRVKYLTSFARQTGAQVDCRLFNFITYQELHLIDHHDGLSRRARILWKPKMMNVNLERAQMWLLRDANEDKEINEISNKSDNKQEPQQQRTFFLSLDSLVYIRSPSTNSKTSTHSVLIDGLKAVWNLKNRRTLFLVYERYRRNNILRSNLSNPFAKELEHLQQEKTANTPSNPSPSDDNITINDELNSTIPAAAAASTTTSVTVTTNGTTSQPSTLASFLDQLINESQHKPSVDLDPVVDASVSLVGLRQCTKDDVEEHTLHIELGDGQIALRGIESRGYVILSAGIALVDQYRHKPVWRDQQLCDKTSWHGNLQGMQYFATTVSSTSTLSTIDNTNNALLSSDDDIIWIPQRDIRDENSLLGESSRSVIGSIATNDGYGDQQLQCIVSKSNANLSYVFYTEQTQQEEETDTNLVIPPFIKPSINESNPIGESDRLLVDSLTFIHNDIQLSTNSSQYRTIMDIVNNLLLYVEPKEEGTNSKLRKLRLQIQLADNLPVLRDSIRHLLERVRSTLANLRRLEREIYFLSRANTNLVNSYSSDEEDGGGGGVRDHTLSYTSEENEKLQTLYTSVKVQLNKLAEKLGMMCAVYKDMQLARLIKLRIAATSNKTARLERRYELHGGSITWFIKHEDGQITNAEFLLRNILYTKRYFENGTNEHSISIGQAQVENLLPDDRYRTILTSNCQQQHTMIRVYCKEGESVGGIAVKEHLEINVAPLVIQMTRRFSQMLMAFLFPNKTQQHNEIQQTNNNRSNKSSLKHTNSTAFKRRTRSAEGEEELLTGRSLFYFSNVDLDAMEKRAKNTLSFQYIKIPEVSLIVSYKLRGTKEKKIGDLENAHISFPTLEYRNLTCSWHDLVLIIKSDVKTVLLSQAIRQNINLRLPFIGKSTRAQNQQLLATTITTTGGGGRVEGTTNNSILFNSDAINNNEISTINEQEEEEEQKHKMKLVLGTKIPKDLITQFKRRKDP